MHDTNPYTDELAAAYKTSAKKTTVGWEAIRKRYTSWGSEKVGFEFGKLEFSSDGKILTATYEVDGFSPFIIYALVELDEEELEELYVSMLFDDVAEDEWYTGPVSYVFRHGMMQGVGGRLFDPDGTTTRAMVATSLWRLEGSPVVNYLMDFEDVPSDQWYTEAIRWASSEKIVEGYGNGKFGTDDSITREQFAAILWRYAKYKGCDVSVGENTNILSYDDAFSVSEYAIPAMQWVFGTGIMESDDTNLMYDSNVLPVPRQLIFCKDFVKLYLRTIWID